MTNRTSSAAHSFPLGIGEPCLSTSGEADSFQESIQPSESPVDAALTGKIMIVDDEPVAINVVRKYLAGAGYKDFVTTTDPQEVMALLAREQPDLIMLDIIMPQLSGLEILARIRACPEFACLPVVIFTVADDQETKVKALELGATDFLGKPLDPSELTPRVRNSLLVKHQQDQLKTYARELENHVAEVTRAEARSRAYAAALEQANEKLRHFRDRVQAANAARNSHLAEIRQKIRAPLTKILDSADLLLRSPLAQEAAAAAAAIQRDGQHVLQLLEELVDL